MSDTGAGPGTRGSVVAGGVAALAAAGLALLLFGSLGHPLLWNDEADTAVLGERVRAGLPALAHRRL